MPKPEKIKQVEELKEKLGRTKSLFVTDYSGLNVFDLSHLRRELKKSGGEFRVAKNTLIRRALEGTSYAEVSQLLAGQTGLGFGYDDPTVPAKIFHDFFKRLEKPKVKVFYLEGRQWTSRELSQIATLPPKEVLLSLVLAGIQAPLVNLVSTLDGMLANLVRTIDSLHDKRAKDSPATSEIKVKEE